MLGGNGEREEKEGKGGREEEQRGEEGWERKRGERGKRGGEITLYQILDKKTKFFAGLLKCLPSCYNYYKLLLLAIEVTLQLLETFKVSCFALCSKFEHIFVAVITFSPPFFCADTFDTSLLLIVCALR